MAPVPPTTGTGPGVFTGDGEKEMVNLSKYLNVQESEDGSEEERVLFSIFEVIGVSPSEQSLHNFVFLLNVNEAICVNILDMIHHSEMIMKHYNKILLRPRPARTQVLFTAIMSKTSREMIRWLFIWIYGRANLVSSFYSGRHKTLDAVADFFELAACLGFTALKTEIVQIVWSEYRVAGILRAGEKGVKFLERIYRSSTEADISRMGLARFARYLLFSDPDGYFEVRNYLKQSGSTVKAMIADFEYVYVMEFESIRPGQPFKMRHLQVGSLFAHVYNAGLVTQQMSLLPRAVLGKLILRTPPDSNASSN